MPAGGEKDVGSGSTGSTCLFTSGFGASVEDKFTSVLFVAVAGFTAGGSVAAFSCTTTGSVFLFPVIQ
jgi:hypothetical protein